MKLLILAPYPENEAPSQRFRFEQYLESIRDKAGLNINYQSFIDTQTWKILYKPGHYSQKIVGILKGFINRFLLLFQLASYHFVFIHREASPIGPPIFEWIIAKIWRKKIIYDFDDAIWLSNTSNNNRIAAAFKWHHKVSAICKWSYKVSVGNQYLADFAKQFNSNVTINPTTIDTEGLHFPTITTKNEKPIIGWTGTHSTMPYLLPILPILDKIAKSHDFQLLVISNQKPSFERPYLEFIPWKKETEILDLQKMNIGIMPLADDQWAKGKCGFKALQYMALRIPAVVSPVGVNTEIVDHGINGFICESDKEWEKSLTLFLSNSSLIEEMADACRQKIVDKYSVLSNTNNFLELFQQNNRGMGHHDLY